jgi:hypothetical protein
MSKTTMIGRIRETVGERIPVSDIRFTVGSLAPVEEPEAAGPDDPPFPAGPDPEGLSAVADPETREILRALLRRSCPPKEIPSKS